MGRQTGETPALCPSLSFSQIKPNQKSVEMRHCVFSETELRQGVTQAKGFDACWPSHQRR